jgi:hypothetical protein
LGFDGEIELIGLVLELVEYQARMLELCLAFSARGCPYAYADDTKPAELGAVLN